MLKSMHRMTVTLPLILLVAPASAAALPAQEAPAQPAAEAAEEPGDEDVTLGDLRRLLEEQARQIEQQRRRIEQQEEEIKRQRQALETQQHVLATVQTKLDQLAVERDQGLSEEDIALRERLEKLESRAAAERDEPDEPTEEDEFPGSIRIPGTNAAFKFGGYVKMSIAKSFDELISEDRFIVAGIPVGDDASGEDGRASLTADQSRINFDFREQTTYGGLRAFVEGDFAGTSEGFRLRHAYGQFRDFLAGKTWSTFMEARQTQIRWFPRFGKRWQLALALEDPQPDVTGGTGVTKTPDLTGSIRLRRGRGHIKTAVLLRQIRAESDDNPGSTDSTSGWGMSFSGRVDTPRWDPRDNVMFQLNFGDGIGRYINDLSTEGGQDGVFDPATGDLEALPAAGGYLAFQHWWNDTMRSTFVMTSTYVDNQRFQSDDAYYRGQRASGNILWSPIPRIDVGFEFIWGTRRNNDGQKGIARQTQMAVKYKF
jgi:hypothetical protein